MPGASSGMMAPGAGAPPTAQPPTNGTVNLWSESLPAESTAGAADAAAGPAPQVAEVLAVPFSPNSERPAAEHTSEGVQLQGDGGAPERDTAAIVQPAKPGEPGADSGSAAASKLAKYWALQGLRGLSIEIDQSRVGSDTSRPGAETSEALTFQSLGTDPELDITVYQQHRMTWLAWAVALFIVVVGLLRAHAPARTRVRWVVLSALLACGLPIIGGPLTEFTVVFEKALLAILALVPLWIVIACVERCAGWFRRRATRVSSVSVTAGVLIALAMFTSLSATATAQDLRELLQPILDQDKPVKIPEDAVVIPYDPADIEQRDSATKVLVPYARYVELWNLAHPDQKIGDQVAAEKFSFAGASYEVILEDAEHVVLRGSLDMELFTDDPLDVPLALQDGVITSALLDGKPARLKAVQPAPAAPQPRPHRRNKHRRPIPRRRLPGRFRRRC